METMQAIKTLLIFLYCVYLFLVIGIAAFFAWFPFTAIYILGNLFTYIFIVSIIALLPWLIAKILNAILLKIFKDSAMYENILLCIALLCVIAMIIFVCSIWAFLGGEGGVSF